MSNLLPGPDTITRVILDNGITVLVYENFASQSVVIAGSLRLGSLLEPLEHNGLAALTVNALMRGTETRTFEQISAAMEDIGADLGLSAGVQRASFFGKSLAEDLPLLIDLLEDALRRPTFPAAQVERLRGEIITSLQIRQHDTRYRASRAFSETLYPADHIFHYSPRGSLHTLPLLTRDHLVEFHARHFHPAGMIIAVVGAVESAAAVETIRARFEGWRADHEPEPIHVPDISAPTEMQRVFVPVAGKSQSDIVIGTLGPARHDPDFKAAQLANNILGVFGMMGRIGQSVREDLGLAYYVYSQLEGGLSRAPWSIVAGVNPANVDLAIEQILNEVRRLVTEPVSAEDLADNQSYLVGNLPLQLESSEGIAGTLLNLETYQLGLDYLINYRDTIYALTRDDLLAAAQHYLNPDALVIAVAGVG